MAKKWKKIESKKTNNKDKQKVSKIHKRMLKELWPLLEDVLIELREAYILNEKQFQDICKRLQQKLMKVFREANFTLIDINPSSIYAFFKDEINRLLSACKKEFYYCSF